MYKINAYALFGEEFTSKSDLRLFHIHFRSLIVITLIMPTKGGGLKIKIFFDNVRHKNILFYR